ncbi:hypothetical protein ASPSYDRAFT_439792 [Aspergillus sydowii CBS 593.65]|uniref:Uncharacterized protein n=1 Tax=Aspergillus sydowii CBS 593.65 TaxID=1036612 RepID=A0A1L9T6M9_9EURO|nr:uncharacterized protein ASPSYDRAFT_439792 [Aspergillus sydowii CBS 593.65]OJJ55035.1 hypothetical protein ASPSYDRAFT_439792 [Aspergillus sydowii CBS 593.65]
MLISSCLNNSGIENIQKPPLPPSTPSTDDTKNTRLDTVNVEPRPTYNETDVPPRRDKHKTKRRSIWGASMRKLLPASREQGNKIVAVPAYGDGQSVPPSDILHAGAEASTVSTPAESTHTISPMVSTDLTSNDTTENLSDTHTSLAGGSHQTEYKDGENGAATAWPDESLPDELAGDSNLKDDPLWETCSESSSDEGCGDTNVAIADDVRRRFTEEDNREIAATEIDCFTDDGEELEEDRPDEDATYDDSSCNDEPDDETRRNSCKLSIWNPSNEGRRIFRQIVDGNDESIPQHLNEEELVDISLLSAVNSRPDNIATYLSNWTEDIETCFLRLHKDLDIDGLQCAILFCWALGLEDNFRHLTGLAQKEATAPLELLPTPMSGEKSIGYGLVPGGIEF